MLANLRISWALQGSIREALAPLIPGRRRSHIAPPPRPQDRSTCNARYKTVVTDYRFGISPTGHTGDNGPA